MDLQFLGSIDGVYQGTWNDVVFSSTNDLAVINDSAYVQQKITKILISPIGNDIYFENYGTALKHIIFDDITDQIIQSIILNSVIGGLAYLQALEQGSIPTEQIKSIDAVNLTLNETKTEVITELIVTSGTDESIEVAVGG